MMKLLTLLKEFGMPFSENNAAKEAAEEVRKEKNKKN